MKKRIQGYIKHDIHSDIQDFVRARREFNSMSEFVNEAVVHYYKKLSGEDVDADLNKVRSHIQQALTELDKDKSD